MQWQPPPPGSVKINFDSSLQNNSGMSGYIIRDCTLIILAEAPALRDGVNEACAAGYKKLIIEGDNLVIIRALLGTTSTPWQITNILNDVRS